MQYEVCMKIKKVTYLSRVHLITVQNERHSVLRGNGIGCSVLP